MAIANEQAYHAQQQAQRAIAVEEPVAESVEEQPSSESLPSDGDLKVMDLSVPVASINQAADVTPAPVAETPAKPRRKLRLHTKDSSPSEPNNDEISG